MPIPSFDDLYDAGRAEIIADRPELQVNEGDVTDVLLSAAAAMADKNLQEVVCNLRKTFINSATGDDLTTLVQDHWGINRNEATLALGTVEFSRSSGGLPAGTLAAGTVVGTDFDADGNRVEFVTNDPIAWLITETGTKSVTVTAQITGTESNVLASTVINIVSNIFDTNITVTNAAAMAGGNEEETDDSLRERARNFPATLRRGTLDALEFGAKQVVTVRNATAEEDPVTGLVKVYVSDSAGASNAQMTSDVTTELEEWRCAGTVVDVLGGLLLTQNVDVKIAARAGTDIAAIKQDIIDSISGAIDKLKIGEDLFHELIQSAARNVAPDSIQTVTVNVPAQDPATSAANELIRAGVVTVA